MNVILAVHQNAAGQRAELEAEQAKIMERLTEIGRDLETLRLYELLAAQRNGNDASGEPGKGSK